MKTSYSNKLFLCAAVVAVGILSDTKVYAQPDGTPLWTNRYNGPGNGEDIAYRVAVDASGDVIVTGSSRTSGGDNDYATIKYSEAGVPLWTNRYNGPGNNADRAYGLAVDGSGNVFVTGFSYSGTSVSSSDYATIAYSSEGVPLWTNRYNGPGHSDDEASAVAVDTNGNVFVTGYSGGSISSDDFATLAYSATGVPLWTNRYNGPGNSADYASALAVDGSGNVIVAGYSLGGASFDWSTIKYSNAGSPWWTNRYNGPGNSRDYANAVAVDVSGNVFVTGDSTGSGSGYDQTTIKYSSAGVPLWTNRYNGPGNTNDFGTALAIDSGGNVIVTGRSSNGSDYDYATIKYSNAGVPLWTNRYNGPGNGNDGANALAVDSSGNVFVTGYSYGGGSSNDLATIAYSSAGVPLWTNRYNGPGNGNDIAYELVVDDSGNVVMTGLSMGTGTSYDFVTIKYSSTGPLLTIAFTTTNTVALSWPSPAVAFTLQQNTNLATTNWIPVGLTPADDGTNKTVIVHPAVGNSFYRLIHP